MFNKIRELITILCLLPMAIYAKPNQCQNPHAGQGQLTICDFTFTATPTYVNSCFGVLQTGLYTIRNNTPASVRINYILINDTDPLPDAAAVIVAAPTDNCVVGSSLAPGASCNIQLNLLPLSAGTFSRTLQVGVDSRQVEISAPTITATIAACVPPPPAPPTPPADGNTVELPAPLISEGIWGFAGVTNTGSSVINGNVNAGPGSIAITGFPPGIITNGAQVTHPANDAFTISVVNYYNSLNALTCDAFLTNPIGSGQTLTPGVYCFASTAQLNGALILTGGPTSSYTFKVGTALTTASGSSIVLSGGLLSGNVNWALGTAATLGTGTQFQGNLLAGSAITLNTGAQLLGRAWALTESVSLDTNLVNPAL